jgi:DNA-binding response OmpR family regulator
MQPAILIVEDNRLVLHMVRDTLELEGWLVDCCEEGRAALRLIESCKHYDLIITDNDLPGASGLDLIRHVRRSDRRRGTPIIMLSASPYEAEARHAGADVFLKKPEDIYVLVETVARLLKISNGTCVKGEARASRGHGTPPRAGRPQE